MLFQGMDNIKRLPCKNKRIRKVYTGLKKLKSNKWLKCLLNGENILPK